MKTNIFALLLLALISSAPAQLPLPGSPNWTSTDNDYSTGGAFADINGDGYLDFCISNGNDMASNRNTIYFNRNGTLETSASWRSADQGYFGHCYAGDVNNDGRFDLAVAYLGDYQGPSELKVRIYYNQDTALETTPRWKAADSVSSFDCCLGDYDLDGDLDLAISAGDAYRGQSDRVRIYRNNHGIFDTLPAWFARLDTASDAIRFADIDNDGDLDLFVGHRRKVVMYRNENGTFDTIPVWAVRRNIGWVLRLEFGDYDRDGYLDLALAANDQLQDPNSIRVFHNNNGTLDTIPAFIMQRRGTNLYSSCVAWGDVNGDGYPELAAGGWWQPVVVYANNAGSLDTLPAWSWRPANHNNLVCEALVWTDVRNIHLIAVTDTFNGNSVRQLFNLSRRPLQFLDSVCVNGIRVPSATYCFDPHIAWISFRTPPPSGTNNITVHYRYSTHPDLAVTNWNQTNGNHLFLNTTATAITTTNALSPNTLVNVFPNPATGAVAINLAPAFKPQGEINIYSRDGRLVRKIKPGDNRTVIWNGRDESGTPVKTGIYFITVPNLPAVKILYLNGN